MCPIACFGYVDRVTGKMAIKNERQVAAAVHKTPERGTHRTHVAKPPSASFSFAGSRPERLARRHLQDIFFWASVNAATEAARRKLPYFPLPLSEGG